MQLFRKKHFVLLSSLLLFLFGCVLCKNVFKGSSLTNSNKVTNNTVLDLFSFLLNVKMVPEGAGLNVEPRLRHRFKWFDTETAAVRSGPLSL